MDIANPELEARILATLADVEVRLHDVIRSDDPLIAEASVHLVDAGGKRFRPLLVALAAQFGDGGAPEIVDAAIVVELTHLATLYHDDVMDEADVRRGAPSANARWTNSVAILVGDYLFVAGRERRGRTRPRCGPDPGRYVRPAGARPDRRDCGRSRIRSGRALPAA